MWKGRWLPQPITFKVASPNLFFCEDLPVVELIDKPKGRWRKELLEALFLPGDVELIMQIPLSESWPNDDLVWHYSLNGQFLVKSAYHLAKQTGDYGYAMW